jgi:uncharacterized membrane protein YgcG
MTPEGDVARIMDALGITQIYLTNSIPYHVLQYYPGRGTLSERKHPTITLALDPSAFSGITANVFVLFTDPLRMPKILPDDPETAKEVSTVSIVGPTEAIRTLAKSVQTPRFSLLLSELARSNPSPVAHDGEFQRPNPNRPGRNPYAGSAARTYPPKNPIGRGGNRGGRGGSSGGGYSGGSGSKPF